jgi:E3 ubiquitin-protein ligase RNF13
MEKRAFGLWAFGRITFVLWTLVHSCRGVVIVGKAAPIQHLTGTFGPVAGTYDVTGEIVLADPRDLCQSKLDLSGKIVVVLRGTCSFVDKALIAQTSNATGIVIGNNVDGDPGFVKMGAKSGSAARSIVIPAVFITRPSYYEITEIITRATKTMTVAELNQIGEVTWEDDWQPAENFRWAGLLLLLPAIWCLGAGLFIVRKCWQDGRARRDRAAMQARLPVVAYRRLSVSSEEGVHNSSCVICLDDFEPSERIKALPCRHGFHIICIDPWLERSELCPVCKTSIRVKASRPPGAIIELEDSGGASAAEPDGSVVEPSLVRVTVDPTSRMASLAQPLNANPTDSSAVFF